MNEFKLKNRPNFPKRAIVTSGMPYGNKNLHCGHLSTFIHSDFYARFLRDRIGKDNVIYVCGTDCYGSPILEGYRKLVESKKFSGSIIDFVKGNHDSQKRVLAEYDISLDLFGASAFGEAKPYHDNMSAYIFNKLSNSGKLEIMSTLQFYDTKTNTFLNGRQVQGKCPFENCKSEHAYADECDQGHQYMPEELIDPISTLSGEKPELRSIENYYLDLGAYTELLNEWLTGLDEHTPTRKYVIKELREFLKKPEIYIKNEYKDKVLSLNLPKYELIEENNKPSFTIVFDKLVDREKAAEILSNNEIRYRTGKTLVPFRLTGNIEWGVKVPDTSKIKGLTFWVWPESLWAPISFTQTYLKDSGDAWKAWWCSSESKAYQFIGEDNIYFYGIAQSGIWLATQGKNPTVNVPDGELKFTQMVANKHTLFLGRKASSSSDTPPPMAEDLLAYYTPEQIRAHMLGANVGNNNVPFSPKPLNPNASPDETDPVLKEGSLYTNVLNRAVRSVFYVLGEHYNWTIPEGKVSESVKEEGDNTILDCERLIHDNKIHVVLNKLDGYIRNINKHFVKLSKDGVWNTPEANQGIVDTLYMIKVATLLSHPIVPKGTEMIADYLNVDKEKFFNWEHCFEELSYFYNNETGHKIKELLPRVDFFKKHPSQLV